MLTVAGIPSIQGGSNTTLQMVFDGGDGKLYQVCRTACSLLRALRGNEEYRIPTDIRYENPQGQPPTSSGLSGTGSGPPCIHSIGITLFHQKRIHACFLKYVVRCQRGYQEGGDVGASEKEVCSTSIVWLRLSAPIVHPVFTLYFIQCVSAPPRLRIIHLAPASRKHPLSRSTLFVKILLCNATPCKSRPNTSKC